MGHIFGGYRLRRRARLVIMACVLSAVIVGGARAAAGALDPGFGTGGTVLTDFGSNDRGGAVAVQKDGKIVVAGTSDAAGSIDFALARYTTNGVPDTSFGVSGNGRVLTDLTGSLDFANGVVVQKDGKIVVAGSTYSDIALVRYTTSGVPDTSFGAGGNGTVLTDLGGNYEQATAVAVQKDGKIVVAGFTTDAPFSGAPGGRCNACFALVRYTTSGAPDPSFGTGGIVLTSIGDVDFAYGLALEKNGEIVVAGASVPDANVCCNADFALVRYTSGGVFEGTTLTDLGTGSSDVANSVVVQKDGKIVVGGASDANGDGDFALVRYTKSGVQDVSFGPGGTGKVLTDLHGGAGFDQIRGLAVQKDGKIVAVGQSGVLSPDFSLVRYTTSGVPDSSFGGSGNGIAFTDFGSSVDDNSYGVAVQKDGRIVVAGDSTANGTADFAVARYAGK